MRWLCVLLVSSILLLFSLSIAQTPRQYFEVNDYSGGINAQSDTGSLKDNQALVMDNLVFNRYGSLQKRYGYKYWNTALLPAGDTILNLHYLYRSKGSNQLLIGTNNYIYASPFGDTVTAAANWIDQRIGYSRGVVDLYDDSSLVYGDTTWWLLSIKVGDYLVVADSTYEIDSILSDTCIKIDRDWVKNDTTDITYKIVRTIVGTPYITSWNSNAYIADDQSSGFYYADSQVYWLNCVDSGTVDSVYMSAAFSIDIDTVVGVYYTPSWQLHRLILLRGTLKDTLNALLDAGVSVSITHQVRDGTDITRAIVGQYAPSSNWWYTNIGENSISYPNHEDYSCRIYCPISFENSIAIEDTSKYYDADIYAGNYLVRGRRPDTLFTITWNSNAQLGIERADSTIDSMFLAGGHFVENRFYIYESIPYMELSDTVKSPHYKQFEFYKNILFAYGYELDKNADTISTGFIYHSDIGLPKKWISFEGFDLSLNNQDRPTSMFNLNDNLIFTTSDKIYKLIGYPVALGNGALVEAISGIGIKDYRAVIRRDNNYAYLARKDGFFVFDGSSINKISRFIDPLIDSYRSAGKVAVNDYIVLGYYDEDVYFSFPTSGYTFVYHEPTKTFTRFKFGMKVFNNQATLIDSSYFLFSDPSISPRRIYKYPTSLYYDSLTPTTTDTIDIRYKTGRFNLGDIKWEKSLEDFWIAATKHNSTDTMYVYFRTDFDSTTKYTLNIKSAVSAATAYRVIDHYSLPLLKGRYFQIEIYAKTVDHLAIEKWGVGWRPDVQY